VRIGFEMGCRLSANSNQTNKKKLSNKTLQQDSNKITMTCKKTQLPVTEMIGWLGLTD